MHYYISFLLHSVRVNVVHSKGEKKTVVNNPTVKDIRLNPIEKIVTPLNVFKIFITLGGGSKKI